MNSTVLLALFCTELPVDARAGENPLSRLELKVSGTDFSFDWSDSDDSLRGRVPAARAGQPLTVSAQLQPIYGQPHEGPVTFALRPLSARGGDETVTVAKPGEGHLWVATLHPTEPGEHRLELAWTTTHRKVVHGVIDVQEAGLPGWLSWVTGLSLVTVAVGAGAWILSSRQESS